MRQINLILSGLFALSMGFAGCNSEEPITSNGTTSGTSTSGTPVAFTAAFSTSPDSEMKKLAYGGLSGTQTSINWTANDRIRIYSSSSEGGSPVEGVYVTDAIGSPAEFAHDMSEVGSNEITWASSFSQAQKFQAFYPAAATTSLVDGKAKFTVPAEQYPTDANNLGMDNVLLYAATSATSQSDNINFQFDNVVTVLELHVPLSQDKDGNDIVIDKIEVRAKGANASKLAGTFTAKTVGANPATGFSDATFEVTNPTNVVTVHTPTTNWTDGTLYIALAPYTYNSLTITLVGEDGTDRIARIVSQEGTNIVAGRKLYPINNSSLKWTEHTVYTGIMVKSEKSATTGGVMTRVIGSYEKTLAWEIGLNGVVTAVHTTPAAVAAVLADATPLYFANGNLLVSNGTAGDGREHGEGYIEPVTPSTHVGDDPWGTDGYGQNSLQAGQFEWGDITGEGAGYEDHGEANCQIAGTGRDIARVKLGEGWRFPTAIEWMFLIDINSPVSQSNHWMIESIYHLDASYNYENSSVNSILVIPGANGKELYFPMVGQSSISGPSARGLYASYHAGSSFYEYVIPVGISPSGYNFSMTSVMMRGSVLPVTE